MKKAKVSKGIVRHVWPHWKKLPDGSSVIKELPPQYRGLNGKPVPDCIIDVPDEVQPGWKWNGKHYAAPVKKPRPMPHSELVEVLAEILGVDHDALMAQIIKRKKARAASKAD